MLSYVVYYFHLAIFVVLLHKYNPMSIMGVRGIMKTAPEAISMYWWEGFYGFKNVFSRMINRKKPYVRNFGDLLSPFIISLLSGRAIQHTTAPGKLLALGSIFFARNDYDIVWGSGFLNPKHIKFALASRKVNYLAVRGPETRKLLLAHNIDFIAWSDCERSLWHSSAHADVRGTFAWRSI